MAAGLALAQSGSEPAADNISERTRRDAESPMRWIKIHSESVRRAEEARKAAAAKPAAAAPSPAPRNAAARPVAAAPAASVAAAAAPARAATPPANEPPEPALISIDRVEPEWDDELLRTLRKGRVVLRFHVAEDGYLSRMQIVESTSSRLTGPAMAAVMQWRFEPIAEPRVATAEFGFDIDSGRH